MKKIFLFLFLFSIFHTYSNDTITVISTKNIYLRVNPNIDSKVISEITLNDTLLITETENGWSKAFYKDSLNGYVKSEFTKEIIKQNKNESQINWKIEILFFCLKILLAYIFIVFSLKYLTYLEKKINYHDKKFKIISNLLFPIVIILISYLLTSWIFLLASILILNFKMGYLEPDRYKYKTKSGKADKRYIKNQETYSSGEYTNEEIIADDAFFSLIKIIIFLIILYIIKLFF